MQVYYGPSVSYGSGINANDVPGPVLGVGQAQLDSVKLAIPRLRLVMRLRRRHALRTTSPPRATPR